MIQACMKIDAAVYSPRCERAEKVCVLIALNMIARVKKVKMILHAGIQNQETSKKSNF